MRRFVDCSNRAQTEKGPQQMLTADAGFYRGSEKGLLTARNAPRSDRAVNFPRSGGRAHSSPAWTPRGENGSAAVIGIGWNDVDIRHRRASNLGLGGLIAGGILLGPMFVFLMALVVEILIGLLKAGGAPALLTLVAAAAIGGFLLQKLRMCPQYSAEDWT
jgi:hypothetical protein